MAQTIHIVGAGLAGSEATWQVARAGLNAVLHEMRPLKQTPAHKTGHMAELVCSNSLKSESENSAPWLLKEELRKLDSLAMRIAQQTRVPAGHALTVDRDLFAAGITKAIEELPGVEIRREEVITLPGDDQPVIIATGPLTSDALAQEIARLTGAKRLFFYDSISPIVDADSIDMSIAFRASRYGKSIDGTDDYVNCPFTKEEYDQFIAALQAAQTYESKIDENIPYFEACLPIEEICRRGPDTLRFGPMKPVGLTDPRTGRWPYAAVQLRQENARSNSFNMVGFQNHLKYAEQARILRMIPGMANAEFLRFGQIHRNTYINAPALLTPTLQLRTQPHVFFAGQISGVEGYTESIATGLLAGRHAVEFVTGQPVRPFPRETALGSLCAYISGADPANYQPANITFDLLLTLDEETRRRLRHDKKARHAEVCRRAKVAMDEHLGVYA